MSFVQHNNQLKSQRVAVVVFDYHKNGGIESLNKSIIAYLESREVSFQVISLNDPKLSTDPDYHTPADVFFPSSRWSAALYNRTIRYRLLRRRLSGLVQQADTLILTNIFLLSCMDEKMLAGKKVFLWMHGIEAWSAVTMARFEKQLRHIHQFVAVSTFTRSRLIANGISPDKIRVVHNPVDTRFFTVERPIAPQNSAVRLLTVGRISSKERYKGHDLVLDALHVLRKERHLSITYTIVGEGDDKDRLRQRVQQENLEQVFFKKAGNLLELRDIYAQADIFIMPSFVSCNEKQEWTGEGLGIVYLEAMSCGLAVIACDTGGQTDVVIDGYNGLLCPPEAAAIAQKIKILSQDESLRMRLGQQGAILARDSFDVSEFYQKLPFIVE